MRNLNKKSAFTLVELLVGLVAGSIVVLVIGAISSIALNSHQKVMREGNVYNDIAYGFKLFQNKIRSSQDIYRNTPPPGWTVVNPQIKLINNVGTPTCTWVNTPGTFDRLFVDNSDGGTIKRGAIGTCNVGGTRAVVFMPNVASTAEKAEVIFTTDAADFEHFIIDRSGEQVTIKIKGEKINTPFEMETVVLRRTP